MAPATSRATIDVVIPARNEEDQLPDCLLSVLGQDWAPAINIIVVANGCSDRTAEIAAGFRPLAAGRGHSITVIELAEGGKARALNAADRSLRGEVHVYLDADVALSAGALRSLHRSIGSEPRARLASPAPVPLLPAGRVARSYAEVWMQLPSVAGDVVGLGCYAVNSAGRARWTRLPDLIADDAYVRSRFAPGERLLLRGEQMAFAFPSGPGMLEVLGRWRRGNRELARLEPSAGPGASRLAALATLARRPSAWRHLPGFAALSAAIWVADTKRGQWPRRAAAPRATPLPLRPRLAVGVIAPGGGAGRLRRLGAELGDRAVQIAVFESSEAGDWAAAASSLAAGEGAELLLLLGPEAEFDPGLLDGLLLAARRFPWAGIYGVGPPRRGNSGRGPAAIRRVERLRPSLLLVCADAWRALAGSERCGEDELWSRVRDRGLRPLQLSAG